MSARDVPRRDVTAVVTEFAHTARYPLGVHTPLPRVIHIKHGEQASHLLVEGRGGRRLSLRR